MRPDVGMVAELLLPVWVRVVWAVVLLGVLGVLAHRAATTTRTARLWHGGYALVAACMIVMFAANPMVGPGPSPDAIVVLVVAVLALVALLAFMVVHRRSGGFGLPWLVASVDLVILGYIQVPSPNRPIPICTLFAAYLAVQVVARGIAAFRARRAEPTVPAEHTEPTRNRTLVGAAGGPAPAAADTASAPSALASPALVPAAMAVLALAMLYMISI